MTCVRLKYIRGDTIAEELPNISDLEEAAAVINSREHISLAAFSYTVGRFINFTCRNEGTNRLGIQVLAQLAINEGTSHPTELSKLLWTSTHSMTIILDNLEKSGHIKRDHDNNDRRSVNVKLTTTGLNFLLQTIKILDKEWEDIIGVLNQDEKKALIEVLKRMTGKFPRDVLDAHFKS